MAAAATPSADAAPSSITWIDVGTAAVTDFARALTTASSNTNDA